MITIEQPPKLQVTNLECIRGERRLFSKLNFTLNIGRALHVKGPNGSGKTTLLRAISGLLLPQEGLIQWCNIDIRKIWEEFCQDTLYLGHLNGIKLELTGIENLNIATTLSGYKVHNNILWQTLAQVGLAGFEDLPCRMLSQGQKRRVAIARLLVTQARLWILDEPYVGLDTKAVNLIQQFISQHLAQGGMVILTTHQKLPFTFDKIDDLELGTNQSL